MSTDTSAGPRARRLAIVAVFAVAAWAIAATSAPYTRVDVPGTSGTLRLDAERPVAIQQLRIALSPEAMAGSASTAFELQVDPPAPSGAATASPGSTGTSGPGSRFFVMAATADVASTDPPSAAFAPAPWQAEVTPGVRLALPMACGGGPCERAFWLIAQLDGENPDPLTVDWHVTGGIGYPGDWPSGATGSVTAGEPVSFPGPVPAIATSTTPETIRIGPGTPALARVIETTIGPEALDTGTSQVAELTLDVGYRGQLGGAVPDVLAQVIALDGGQPSPQGVGEPMDPGADPFAGCPTGEACTRRFLVTFAWAGTDPRDIDLDWSATVRRTDLVNVWTTPAALEARVTRRLDLADAPPVTTRLEGDVTPTDDRAPQVRVRTTTGTTSDDVIASLLPEPATYRYRAELDGPVPSGAQNRTTVVIAMVVPGRGTDQRYGVLENGSVDLQSSVLTRSGACRIGDACDLEISLVPPRNPQGTLAQPGGTYHWTLEMSVRSYEDVPVDAQVEQAP